MLIQVSFLEVPPGETAMSAMAKRIQQAIDQATIDAHTEAISKGLSGTQAQVRQPIMPRCMMHGILEVYISTLAK
jgi:hypothetical protein